MLLFGGDGGGGALRKNWKILLTLAMVLGGLLDQPHGSLALKCRRQGLFDAKCDPEKDAAKCMIECLDNQLKCFAYKFKVETGDLYESMGCIGLPNQKCWEKAFEGKDLDCFQTGGKHLGDTRTECKVIMYFQAEEYEIDDKDGRSNNASTSSSSARGKGLRQGQDEGGQGEEGQDEGGQAPPGGYLTTVCSCETDGCNANCYGKCEGMAGASSIRPSVPLQGILGMMTTAPVLAATLLAYRRIA